MSVFADIRRCICAATSDWVIKRLREDGMSVPDIAKQIGRSQSTVRRSIKKTSGWTKGEKA